jgi:UDP-2,3-diacylglucosamine pyrophosphatase LpxH
MLLRRAAWRIANTTGTPCIIFGHSHHPERVNLNVLFGHGRHGAPPAVYINSGSWVTNEGIRGETGQGMTFVEIIGHEAKLCRWCGEKTTPEVLG